MKRLAVILAFVTVFGGCANVGLEKRWGSVRRSQIVPVPSGKCLYAEQDVYGLLAANGEVLWSKEVANARRVSLKKFGDTYYVLGDNTQLERINLFGNTIWKYNAPSGSSIFPVASSKSLIVAAFDQDSTYPLNGIELVAFSVADGTEAWRLSDRDYQQMLLLPPQDFFSEIIIAPYIRGTTAWIDGIRAKDGTQLWRSLQSIPRSGHPFILAQTEEKIWLWQAKDEGVEAFVLNRQNGALVGKSSGASYSMADYAFVRNQVFVFFRDRTYRIDEKGKYSEFKSEWMPISSVPGVPDKFVVLQRDCEKFGIMDEKTMKVEEGFKLPVCYYGIPGLSPGEFYLVPEVDPFDHQAFKMTYFTAKEVQAGKSLDALENLGKNKSLFDVLDSVRKIRQ